jgi:hypothetical protein
MDWVAFEATAGQRVYLVGSARWRAALATGLVFLVLLGVGWAVPHAALAVLPVSLAAAVALGRDPWLVHQLLT